ncbi:MAG: hypothetical protein IJI35_11860, partial [Kiritimatiellae bacterium]|nr:hypothetical protein [Kiritimatiellia bacterium]
MDKNQVRNILAQIIPLSVSDGYTERKKTVYDTSHIGVLSGNRLNSGTLRSQFIIFMNRSEWDNNDVSAKRALHSDQRVFVQNGDDIWDVYKGVDLAENNDPILIKSSVQGLALLLQSERNELIAHRQPCVLTQSSHSLLNTPYQLITYGAPGTGKSWSVKQETRGKSCIRTTFHPDSDYSTFVGAYKPSMEEDEYDTVVTTGEKIAGGTISKKDGLVRQKRIVYKFVAQAFLEAYVEAWRKCAAFLAAQDDDAKNAAVQFLVVEEVNRGNCAQIFGDIFQLLDREDDGYSSYAIKSDADLCQYLKDAFERASALDLTGVNLGDRDVTPDEIKSGEKMLLPPNMLIRATMNTSDQSLFPIDSAFKRRWDWKYVPIKDEGKGWFVSAGGKKFDWWKFLQAINKIIYSETSSADKQLGYFFIKMKEGTSEITSTTFVNKVAFYLWNDVFKDCELVNDAFKLKDADGKTAGKLMFTSFFKPDSEEVDEAVVEKLLSTLMK